MLTFLRGLVFVGVIIHLSLLLVESSYFNGLFSFLGHTGLMLVHITVLSLVTVAALTPVRRQSLGTPWLTSAVIWVLYTAWAVFCTLPSVHTFDRMCELILSPLTMAALFLCVPAILERRHYRAIFLLFSAVLALHTLCVAWIMCTKNPMFFGQQVIDRTNGHPKLFGRILLPNTDGIFLSANGIGSFLALFPAILLSEFLSAPRRLRAPLAVTNAIICVGLLLSFCRAAQASVLVGLLLPAFVFLKKTPVKRMLVCAAILLMTVLACFPDRYQWVYLKSSIGAHAAGPDALHQVTAFVAHTVTTRRTEIWLAFLRDWQAHPIFGYGLLGIDYRGLGPHNFLLANLVYFGIPGLVLLVALLSAAARQVVVRLQNHRELLVPIAGGLGAFIIVHGAAEYSITYPVYFANSVFWLLLGYACFTPLGETADSPEFNHRILENNGAALR